MIRGSRKRLAVALVAALAAAGIAAGCGDDDGGDGNDLGLITDGTLFIGRIKSFTVEEKVIIPRADRA